MDAIDALPVLPLRSALSAPIITGLAAYFLYKRYEIDPSNPVSTLLLLIFVPLVSSAFLLHHLSPALSVLVSFSAFYSTLLSSLFIYRVSPWHPLAKYPGPLLARVSQLWLAQATASGRWHVILKKLHAQYGPYVRIGPNQLSFVDASLVPYIMGADGMPKGPMFDGARMPGVPSNVVATRDLADHTQLRKPWTKGLSSASIKEYTPTVIRRALQLAEELEKHASKNKEVKPMESVDLAMWMSRFSFDFMGDMAFGGAFELMKEGDVHGIWSMIDQNMKVQSIIQRIPWSVHVIHKLPFVVKAMERFTKFTTDCAEARKARGPREKDIFYHFVNEEEGPEAYPPQPLVNETCKVAIVAGSDTTATTLSNLFYYLLANPEVLKRLRTELDEAFPVGEGDPFDFTRLSELPILNAVINETLRLQPPVPTDLQRAPAAGTGFKWIGEHFLPEGTSVNVPPYVMHRQPRYFSPLPETFWIDRWLQTPSAGEKSKVGSGFVHDLSAYIPFSYGPANCAGKMLALSEMRTITALLLQRFEIKFEPGYDPARWEKEINNYFVVKLGPLPVVLSMRSHA